MMSAIADAAILGRSTEMRFGAEPVAVKIIPDICPAAVENTALPAEWLRRAAQHCPNNAILTREEVARLLWSEYEAFVEALVDSVAGTVPGEPRCIVTAPDIVVIVKHTPVPEDLPAEA
jgi:hypothetical protein